MWGDKDHIKELVDIQGSQVIHATCSVERADVTRWGDDTRSYIKLGETWQFTLFVPDVPEERYVEEYL